MHKFGLMRTHEARRRPASVRRISDFGLIRTREAHRLVRCVFGCALLAMTFPPAAGGQPVALHPGIDIEHFARPAPRSIRLDLDPVTGNLHYNTIDGDIYDIRISEAGEPESVKIATAEDHGITRLQGMAFSDSTLFLLGNVMVNDGRGTRGRLMAGRYHDGTRAWTNVLMTEAFGTVKTVFDHGFNAITVSPDGDYLYFTSGSRTDHGEVQDNDGYYPGAREEPLTAAIFRIPISTRNLTLPNDRDALVDNGYLYAEGIRNAFDHAFSPSGHLFAVSNSGDYDHPEDMFWVREGHHYGYPWIMGGIENPQQYPDFEPDPDKDPFINPRSHAYVVKYFHNDPDFPQKPPDLRITPSIPNVGPDANYFRDRATGKVLKGDRVGTAVSTFTAHRSPLGLEFDVDSVLAPPFRGDAFVLSWTNGKRSTLMGRLSELGSDLMHLKLFFSPGLDNYIVQSSRIAEGFAGPTDAVLLGNVMYVLEYGGNDAHIWKLTLPVASGDGMTSSLQE